MNLILPCDRLLLAARQLRSEELAVGQASCAHEASGRRVTRSRSHEAAQIETNRDREQKGRKGLNHKKKAGHSVL